jgi:genome maintenance exonuclease 1
MKKFFHNPVNLPDLETVSVDGKRHYVTPGGTFPSVTTVLGEKLSKDGLIAWRERVGEEEANKISTQAANRGTAIHALAEAYLMNNGNWKRGAMPTNLETFSRIKPHLDLNVGTIYGVEVPLWSDKLKTAGRTDLLAGWRGINSIIDFKTSRRIKTEDHIESYFLQATCYSMMAEERTGMKIPQIVIIIAVDHEETQVFVKERDKYVQRVLGIFCR